MTGVRRRRFWQAARVRPESAGFTILLDARMLQTPAKAPLIVPTEALAVAIATEWDALGEEIRPEALPFTRAANSAIDRVTRSHGEVARSLAEYGGADLLCYRADAPTELRARQAAAWDPLLAWAAEALRAPLITATGVMHRPQPEESLAALRDAVAAHDPFALTALHDLVTISGSLVLGLAVSRGALGAEQAWALSRIDETWQAEHWGRDAEAEAVEALKHQDFLRAETLLGLLSPQGRRSEGRQRPPGDH